MRHVLYWLLVVVVAYALAIVLLIFLEDRDPGAVTMDRTPAPRVS